MVMASSENRTWYIYCHTAPNGKRYIGQTCQEPEKRWANGHGYRDQLHFKRAIDKYGWDNFKHSILCSVSCKEYADFLEQWFIEKWDTFNPEHGYNHTKGGGGNLGRVPSEEERRKISECQKGKTIPNDVRQKISQALKDGYASGRIEAPSMSEEARKKMSEDRTGSGNPMYGVHHSAKTRAQMSRSRTGIPHTTEWRENISAARYASDKIPRRAVNQYTVDGALIAQYRSIKEASEATGIVSTHIYGCCNHLNWTAKGTIWRYQDRPETFPPQQTGLFS